MGYVFGTSSCTMTTTREPVFVPGVWGPYFSAMIPGAWLNEGGQSAAGAAIDQLVAFHPASARGGRTRCGRRQVAARMARRPRRRVAAAGNPSEVVRSPAASTWSPSSSATARPSPIRTPAGDHRRPRDGARPRLARRALRRRSLRSRLRPSPDHRDPGCERRAGRGDRDQRRRRAPSAGPPASGRRHRPAGPRHPRGGARPSRLGDPRRGRRRRLSRYSAPP